MSEQDEVFVIPQENDGKPVRELTRELTETLDGIEGATKVVIPDSVTSIEDGAFEDCASLTSVEIPNSVTSIGKSAFEDCASLTSVEIPANAKLEKDAFPDKRRVVRK